MKSLVTIRILTVLLAPLVLPVLASTTLIILKRNDGFKKFCPEFGNEYYLTVNALRNNSLIVHNRMHKEVPFRFEYEWMYNAHKHSLIHCWSNLCLTVNNSDWTLHLAKCGEANQAFIYKNTSKELFWKNPKTKRWHIIFAQQDLCDRSVYGKNRFVVAVNDMSMFDKFWDIGTLHRRQHLWRILTTYALNKCNGTRHFSAETIQNWMDIIEAFSFHNVTFGLFKTAKGGYLIGDGHVITTTDAQQFEKSDYKYYGLWRFDPLNRCLIHYLSDYTV